MLVNEARIRSNSGVGINTIAESAWKDAGVRVACMIFQEPLARNGSTGLHFPDQ